MYLLDTNALSELLKKRPNPQFLMRLRRHPPEMFFTSIICVMELRHGSRRRGDHAVFWRRITHEVLSRVIILDFSASEAVAAGDILAHLARRGELIGPAHIRSARCINPIAHCTLIPQGENIIGNASCYLLNSADVGTQHTKSMNSAMVAACLRTAEAG